MTTELCKLVASRIEQLPRVRLSQLPTPLDELTNLTGNVGGPRLYFKRDDLTTFAMGGNKVRKLEFALGEAQKRGADVIVTGGAVQSNHSRVSAAAAAMAGLKCQLVLGGDRSVRGNAFLDKLFGADIVFLGDVTTDEINAEIKSHADWLRSKGHRPYEMQVVGGPETLLGVIGYILAYFELADQLERLNIRPTHIFICAGSAASQAGLLLGARIMGHPTRVIGISIRRSSEELRTWIKGYVGDVRDRLGFDVDIDASWIEVNDDYVGPGYAVMTPVIRETILSLARSSGIVIDHVYAGKALTGVLDLIQKGALTHHDTVVFVHTGGAPSLFASAEQLMAQEG